MPPDEFATRRPSAGDRAARAQCLQELHAELAGQRFTGRSADRAASAVVDGNGRLVDLDIEDAALRGAKPQTIGPAVLAAIAAARSLATETSQQRLHEVLGVATEQPPAPRPAPADDDEDFGDTSIMVRS